jgi:hypothetical protein
MLQCLHDVRIVDISSNNIKRIVDYADIWNSVVTRCLGCSLNLLENRVLTVIGRCLHQSLIDYSGWSGICKHRRAGGYYKRPTGYSVSEYRTAAQAVAAGGSGSAHCVVDSVQYVLKRTYELFIHETKMIDKNLGDELDLHMCISRFCVKRIPCASRKCWARFPVLTESL